MNNPNCTSGEGSLLLHLMSLTSRFRASWLQAALTELHVKVGRQEAARGPTS